MRQHRDIFIGWIGPKVGIVQKGRKKAHVGEVKELLKVLPLSLCFFKLTQTPTHPHPPQKKQPFHAELFALRRTNFTESVVRENSAPGTGSHMID
jgi:hypothetical protein